MITNIRLELSNEERSNLGTKWHDKGAGGMVSRKVVTQMVNEFIQRELGHGPEEPSPSEELPGTGRESGQIDGPGDRPPVREPGRTSFTPSRGDEPYLYKPGDDELREAVTNVLDGLELIEGKVHAVIDQTHKG